MATTYRKRSDGMGGDIENADALATLGVGLTQAGTSLSSAALASMPAVGTDEYYVIRLDPDGEFGAPETAWMTAHGAGATTGTLLRGQEGSSARDHPRDVKWAHAPTAADFAMGPPLLYVRDEKAQNTVGGTFTSGAWQTRTLNTVKTNEIVGASLAANQVTLAAGIYEIDASAPAGAVNSHQAKLYNVTDAVDLLIGTTEYTDAGTYVMLDSRVRGRFTITATKVIELQHRCQTTRATNGLGSAANLATEVYAELLVRRLGY